MGVGTGVGSMSTTTDVIYTHKKFKRAATEAWESKEAKKNADERIPRQSELPKLLPTTSNNVPSTELNHPPPPPPASSDHHNFNGHAYEKLDNVVPYESKFLCTQCGFVCMKQALFNQHVCIPIKETFYCQECRQSFRHQSTYRNHDCLRPNPSQTYAGGVENLSKTSSYEASDKVAQVPKVSFSRSQSLPFGYDVHSYNEENSLERPTDRSLAHVPGTKQIYKPKFRAQYSFQEENNVQSPAASTLASSSAQKPVQRHEEVSSSASNVSSSTYQPPFFNPSSSHFSNHGKSTVSGRSSKGDEFSSLSKGVTSQCSAMWKGIKSPSPEIVGKHINNLIVQNQAIVETHNPLWGMKYRRQASTGSSLEGEGGTSQKLRKASDTARANNKSQNNPAGNYSRGMSLETHAVADSSLPQTYFSYALTQSSSSVRASKNISTPSLPTSLHLSKVKSVDVYSQSLPALQYDNLNTSILIKSQNATAAPEASFESLDLSKSSKTKIPVSPLPCNKCGTSFLNLESRDHHLRYGCPQTTIFSCDKAPSQPPMNLLEIRSYEEQEVALDLHKKKERHSPFELERSSSRGSTISEPGYRQILLEEELSSRGLSISPRQLQSPPPSKRRKLSSADTLSQEKPLYSIFTPNGKVVGKNNYAVKMMEEFGKPKGGNIHHLYGGEVQICDGVEMKTLKIDSIKSETPSLDLCIASKHMGVDLESTEAQLPTSVVVTIAKSGLNSGGTMVKVENQSPSAYPSRKVGLPSTCAQTNSIPNRLQHHEQASNLSPYSGHISPSPLNFHPSLIQYSPISSTEAQKSPSPNLSGLSFQLRKGSSGSVISSMPSPHPSTAPVYDTANVHSLGITTTSESLVCYKEPDRTPPQNIIHPLYPSVISIGDEVVPYVPGIPGPYSQAGVVFKNPGKLIEPLPPIVTNSESVAKAALVIAQPAIYFQSNAGLSSPGSSVMTYTSLGTHSTSVSHSLERSKSKDHSVDSYLMPKLMAKPPPTTSAMPKPPEIKIQPPPLEIASPQSKADNKVKSEADERNDFQDDGKTFLMPRKRPNTLIIKPQSYSLKSSLSLIGSTLVSPDTPRPKKSCAQLFLNGSAYTYLNLKVSTKTFFCCIYRPQPMYVLQSTNPKLSMYSNWQVRKSENPLNISPAKAMSLHVSGLYYNKAYTIAQPKQLEYNVTDSSYWTRKESKATRKPSIASDLPNSLSLKKENTDDLGEAATEPKTSKGVMESRKEKREGTPAAGSCPKRIKIFEGGFKTNEDYTYVRGRGRGRYVCETCGIRCKKPSMLKKHIRTHTDLRPFACKHCSFSFKTKGNLTKHLKSKAHFKRCTEMGIVPVPVTVNESHVNHEALQLQGLLDNGKDSAPGSEEGDEEDDDDDDEEEEEEEDDDDEEEEEEEEDEEEEHDFKGLKSESLMTSSVTQSRRDSSPSLSSHSSVGALEEYSSGGGMSSSGVASSGGVMISSGVLNLSGVISSSGVSARTPKISVNYDSIPMDLSVKRPSVITASSQADPSSRERPCHLPLPKKGDSAPPAIKEHPADILSPVTESSLLLKSIYNTTLKVSSSNLERSCPKEECGVMLQTYLTERAVLDSARKRHQYLQAPLEDSSKLMGSSSSRSSGGSCMSVTITPSPVGSRLSSQGVSSFTFDEAKMGSAFGAGSFPSPVSAKAPTTTTTPSLPPTPVVTSQQPVSVPCAPGPPVSSQAVHLVIPEPPPSSTGAKSLLQPGQPLTSLSLSGITHSLSSAGSTIITTSKPGGAGPAYPPGAPSSSAGGGRKNGKAYPAPPLSSPPNPMPTPPANLTVLNNCTGGDSKTAFIAPSGVIPSPHNIRMGSDDGKCKCSVCHKEFAKQGQLRLHINIHYIERPHRCDSCGISFRTNGHLQKHKRSVSHFNKVNMNMTFGTPSTANPRPFKCHDCKSAFRIYGHLAKHLRSKLHIMKLECLGKLPFGTYAEIERSGVNLNEIDTSDCENSLESLQLMASKLYEKEPSKLEAWQTHQQEIKQARAAESRERTVSNSSNNSEDYPLLDEHESALPSCASTSKSNEEESGDEDDPGELRAGGSKTSLEGGSLPSSPSPLPQGEAGSSPPAPPPEVSKKGEPPPSDQQQPFQSSIETTTLTKL